MHQLFIGKNVIKGFKRCKLIKVIKTNEYTGTYFINPLETAEISLS